MGMWGSLKQMSETKLNMESYTEEEIVRVSDYLPKMIWARTFLEAQGFIMTENTLHQDNQSTIKLNARASNLVDRKQITLTQGYLGFRID